MAKIVIDKKTGKKRRVDPARSKAATKGARKRKGKHLSATTRRKISTEKKRTNKKGVTKTGRRVLKKKTIGAKIKKTEKIEKKAGKIMGKKIKNTEKKRRGPYKIKMPSMTPMVVNTEKKKRGRPAKAKVEAVAPKKRGRPAKAKTETVAKKRGRPAKIKTEKVAKAVKAVKKAGKKVIKTEKKVGKKAVKAVKKVAKRAMKVTGPKKK